MRILLSNMGWFKSEVSMCWFQRTVEVKIYFKGLGSGELTLHCIWVITQPLYLKKEVKTISLFFSLPNASLFLKLLLHLF